MKRFCLILIATILTVSTADAALPTIALDLGGDMKLEMVLVKSGTFQQGSPTAEEGRGGDESPRQVVLTQDFYLGKFPVTVGHFAQFVRDTGYRTEAERGTSGGFGFDGKALVQRKEFTWRNPGFNQNDDHPVTIVTWADAQAMARWLAKRTHRKVSLPTEAQWEYACRAGTTTRFASGDTEDDLQKIAWYKSNAGDGTRPVGQKQPSAFGLYDMSGNVYQWCRDWYGPYEAQSVKNPEETRADRTKPPRRVLRGGSWLKDAQYCRSAARWRNTPASRNADNGFRLAASVEVIVEQEDTGRTPPPGGRAAFVSVTPVASEQANLPWAQAGAPLLGVLCIGVVVLGVIAVVALAISLARRQSDQSGFTQQPGRGPFDVGGRPYADDADDGFWLNTAGVEVGSIIRYRCLVHGAVQQNNVVTEMGPRQFIYTGGRPTEIMILETIPPGGIAVAPPLPTPVIVPSVHRVQPPPPPPEPQSFSGYPTAY